MTDLYWSRDHTVRRCVCQEQHVLFFVSFWVHHPFQAWPHLALALRCSSRFQRLQGSRSCCIFLYPNLTSTLTCSPRAVSKLVCLSPCLPVFYTYIASRQRYSWGSRGPLCSQLPTGSCSPGIQVFAVRSPSRFSHYKADSFVSPVSTPTFSKVSDFCPNVLTDLVGSKEASRALSLSFPSPPCALKKSSLE